MTKMNLALALICFLTSCTSFENQESKKNAFENVNFSNPEYIAEIQKEKIPARDNFNSNEYFMYGQSFGMCTGYCVYEIKYTSGKLEETKSSWQAIENPPKISSKVFSNESFVELWKLIDLKKFEELPDRIGCPDCLDGGASWIEICYSGKTKRILYDYGYPPSELIVLETELKKQSDNNE